MRDVLDTCAHLRRHFVEARPAGFQRMVRRLAGMLAPGGLFLHSVTAGATRYIVNGTVFARLDPKLGKERDSLVEAGPDPGRLSHAKLAIEGDEYSHLLLSAGWKL
jgi:hypothetical protein